MTENTATVRPPLPPSEPDILKSTPARPPQFVGGSAELRALEQTLALMNNPELKEGLSQEEILRQKHALRAQQQETMMASDIPRSVIEPEDTRLHGPAATKSLPESPVPASAPTPAPQKILLTGRTGVGKDYIASRLTGAHVLNLRDPILMWAAEIFPGRTPEQFAGLVQTMHAWGTGEVSDKFPITPARALALKMARETWGEKFGTANFWINRVISVVDQKDGQKVVTQVDTVEEFHALIAAGFAHYHVICSSMGYNSRPKRTGANDSLAAALDQDVIKKISAQRNGPKLRCIWSDSVAPISGRLMLVDEFVQAMITSPANQIELE